MHVTRLVRLVLHGGSVHDGAEIIPIHSIMLLNRQRGPCQASTCSTAQHVYHCRSARRLCAARASAATSTCTTAAIPDTVQCFVAVAEVSPGLMGLEATRFLPKGTFLLDMEPDHTLAVPTNMGAYSMWKSEFVKPFKRRWKVQLPEYLLDVIQEILEATAGSHSNGHYMALAVLLLWVRKDMDAPFWQQYLKQLSPPEEYTAAGSAWSPAAVAQLQWPLFQGYMQHISSQRVAEIELLASVLAFPSSPVSVLVEGGSKAARSAAAWALGAVHTRAWAIDEFHVLLPFTDSANHSSMPVAEVGIALNCSQLRAAEDIQEGQEVTVRYADGDSAKLLTNWGFIEPGNSVDCLHPIQRPLQLLPRLPWDIVLAAAGRLLDLAGLSPQQLQQQALLPLSKPTSVSLSDGSSRGRVLAAAASLPVLDGMLTSLDPGAAAQAVEIEREAQQRSVPSYLQLPASQQGPLWQPPARAHIVQRVLAAAGKEEGTGASKVVATNNGKQGEGSVTLDSKEASNTATAHTPLGQQRWEESLAALTATLLGLHARVGLLAMPTTLEEDLVLEKAITTGQLSVQQVAQVAGQLAAAAAAAHAPQADALRSLQQELMTCTRALAAAGAGESTGSKEQVAKVGRVAGLLLRAGAATSKLAQARSEHSQLAYLQQLLQAASSGAGVPGAAAAAAAGSEGACTSWAIKARLEQKRVLHVYVYLCDMIESDLTPMPKN